MYICIKANMQYAKDLKNRKVKKQNWIFNTKHQKSGLGCANLEGLPEKRNCNAEHGDLSVQGV